MARPRVFISSTYYDLKYIRSGIESFVDSMGYESVLFEKGDIPFHHDVSLEENCYKEVDNADILVLIMGGRYGSLSKEDVSKIETDPLSYMKRIKSVTNREYERARKRDIPTYIFVEKSVFAEYGTYKENKGNDTVKYAHFDDPRIYDMIEDILQQARNNFVKEFTTLEDITSWLRSQWAGIFSNLIRSKVSNADLKSMEQQVSQLTDVVKTLRNYNEAIIKAVNASQSHEIIEQEQKKLDAIQIRRFVSSSFARFVMRIFDVDKDKMLEAFVSSTDNDEFLARLGSQEKPEAMLEARAHMAAMTEDFHRFKELFGEVPARVQDLDIEEADSKAPEPKEKVTNTKKARSAKGAKKTG